LPDPTMAESRQKLIDPAMPERAVNDLNQSLQSHGFRPEAFEGYGQFLKRLLAPQQPPRIDALAGYPDVAQLVLPRDAFSGTPITDAITLVSFTASLENRSDRDAALGALRECLSDLDGVTVTGMAAISRDVEAGIHRDLPKVLIAAVVCIAGYLVIHFRSLI